MKISKMKNENKMRGRGIQFGPKRESQSNPKFKNQKKMTLRRRGIKVKKLNRKRKEKEKNEKRERKKTEEKEKEKEKNEKTSSSTIDGETNVTIHPVAPANYIMIFNGPKGKTWPPKIFGRGVG